MAKNLVTDGGMVEIADNLVKILADEAEEAHNLDEMKILEAMSVGAPIVFSTKSADGLPGFPQELRLDHAETFLAEISNLLDNPSALEQRAQFARSYFEQYFEAIQVQKQLVQILEELQNNR